MAEYYIPVGEVVKLEPKSEGIDTPRKKRPKELAVITECCTGCAGSPACVPYCPVADCMYWVAGRGPPAVRPTSRWTPNSVLAARSAPARDPTAAFLDGCPWDAIEMVPIEEVEVQLGTKFTF